MSAPDSSEILGPSGFDEARNAELQAYFTALAPDYGRLTSNVTQTILADVLDSMPLGINSFVNIHDNASGPGTAAQAVNAWCSARAMLSPNIIATDMNSAMIAALEGIAETEGYKNVTAKVMDSHALTYQQDTFKFVFCNFSVFTFAKPLLALMEIHRTLRHTGIAVITCWKRFGVAELIKRAQEVVKGSTAGGPEMKAPGSDFFKEGYLAWLVEEAGWERGKIKTLEKRVVISGDKELEGLIEFVDSDHTAQARTGWTEEEKGKWPAAVKEAVAEMKHKEGGIFMEAWVVLARKWDALSA